MNQKSLQTLSSQLQAEVHQNSLKLEPYMIDKPFFQLFFYGFLEAENTSLQNPSIKLKNDILTCSGKLQLWDTSMALTIEINPDNGKIIITPPAEWPLEQGFPLLSDVNLQGLLAQGQIVMTTTEQEGYPTLQISTMVNGSFFNFQNAKLNILPEQEEYHFTWDKAMQWDAQGWVPLPSQLSLQQGTITFKPEVRSSFSHLEASIDPLNLTLEDIVKPLNLDPAYLPQLNVSLNKIVLEQPNSMQLHTTTILNQQSLNTQLDMRWGDLPHFACQLTTPEGKSFALKTLLTSQSLSEKALIPTSDTFFQKIVDTEIKNIDIKIRPHQSFSLNAYGKVLGTEGSLDLEVNIHPKKSVLLLLQTKSQPKSLADIIQDMGIPTSQKFKTFLPTLKLSLEHLHLDTTEQLFIIAGGFALGNFGGNARLFIRKLPRLSVSVELSRSDTGQLSIKTLEPNLPISLEPLTTLPVIGNMIAKVRDSQLYSLQIALDTGEKSLKIAFSGKLFDLIEGNVTFTASTAGKTPVISFEGQFSYEEFFLDEFAGKLGLSTLQKYLPHLSYELSYITFDQGKRHFRIEGDITTDTGTGESIVDINLSEDNPGIELIYHAREEGILTISNLIDPYLNALQLGWLPQKFLDQVKKNGLRHLYFNVKATPFAIALECKGRCFGAEADLEVNITSDSFFLKLETDGQKDSLSNLLTKRLEIIDDKAIAPIAPYLLPQFELGLQKFELDTKHKRFSIAGIIGASGKGEGELGLSLQFMEEGINIRFQYLSPAENCLTIGDLTENILPDSLKTTLPKSSGSENILLKNLKESGLTELKLNMNSVKKEFSFLAVGTILNMKGKVEFSIKQFFGKPMTSFHIYADAEGSLQSIPNILQNTLGFDIPKEITPYLPRMEFAIAELSFDQQAKSFALAVKFEQGESTIATAMGIKWQQGLAIDMTMDVDETPLSFQAVSENLPIPQQELNRVVPAKLLEEIAFHHLAIHLGSAKKRMDIVSTITLFGGKLQSAVAIFRHNNAMHFSLAATIDQISMKRMLQSIAPLPPNFPELAFKEVAFTINTKAQAIAFKGKSALVVPYIIGNATFTLALDIDAAYHHAATVQKLTGTFKGMLAFAGVNFTSILTLGTENKLAFQQAKALPGAKTPALANNISFKIFLQKLTGQAAALPPEVPDFTIADLKGAVNFTTQELSFSGKSTIDWDLLRNGSPIKATVEVAFDRVLQQNSTPKKYNYQGKLQIKSQAALALTPDLALSNYAFDLRFDGGNWHISGALNASVFQRTFSLDAGIASTNTHRAITLKSQASGTQELLKVGALQLNNIDFDLALRQTKSISQHNISGNITAQLALTGVQANITAKLADTLTFKASIPKLQLATFCSDLLSVELPEELPDITFQNIAFEATPTQKTFSFYAEVTTGNWQLNAGAASIGITKAVLDVKKDARGLAFSIKTIAKGQITDDIKFKQLSFAFGYDQTSGWQLQGEVQSNVFGHEFTLAAGYANQTLTLSYEKDTKIPLIQVPDIGAIDVSRVSLSLQRKDGKTNWEFSSDGMLKILKMFKFSGTLSFKQEGKDTTFSFIPKEATIKIPLFPLPEGDELAFFFEFGPIIISRKKIGKKSQWGFEASVSFSCPKFHDVLPAEIQQILPEKITTRLIARGNSVRIVTDTILDARINIPPIMLEGAGEIPIGLIRFSLTNLVINIGRELSLSLDLGLGLPSSMNKNFGVNDKGEPIVNLFNTFNEKNPEETTLRLRLLVGTKGVKIMLVTSPFAFIKFQDEGNKVWCLADFGECGAVRFQVPEFSFDLKKRSFKASGGFETVRELGIPLHLVKLLLKEANAEEVGKLLPDKASIRNISLLNEENKLDMGGVEQLFSLMFKQAMPGELKTAFTIMEESVNRLPDNFRKYLNITVPKSFNFDIDITPENQGVSVKVGVKKGDPPVRVMLPFIGPTASQFIGIELHSFTLGELFSTNFLLVELDARIDYYDIFTLAGSLALGTNHGLPLPSSNEVSRHFIIEEFLVLIFMGIKVYGVPVPIPIPLFYKELGFEYCGLEGVRTEGHIGFPKPELNIGGLIKSMVDLVKFVSQPKARMNPKAFGGMDIKFRIGANYFQLPDYLGGGHIGTKTGLPLPGAYELMAMLLNAIKFGSLTEIIEFTPLEHRMSFENITFYGLSIQSNCMLTTLSEFHNDPALVAARIAADHHELGSLLPTPGKAKKSPDGLVTFLQGGFDIGQVARFESTFVLATVKGQSFATGFLHKGILADLFSFYAKGYIQIDTKKSPVFDAYGTINMHFLNEEVLKGKLQMNDQGLTMEGALDLFPDVSPLQVKADITGHIRKDSLALHGEASVVLGDFFTLAKAYININEQEFLIKGDFLDQTVIMALQRKGAALRFFATMTPVTIGPLFSLTGNSPHGGPMLYLELGDKAYQKPAMQVMPVVKMEPEEKNEWIERGGENGWINISQEKHWQAQGNDPGWQTDSSGIGWQDKTTWQTASCEKAPATKVIPLIPDNQPNPLFGLNNYENWIPSGEAFRLYLSARIVLLGMSSETEISISKAGIFMHMTGDMLGMFTSEFHVVAQVLEVGASFRFDGTMEVMGSLFTASGDLLLNEEGPKGVLSLRSRTPKSVNIKGFELEVPQATSRFNLYFDGPEFYMDLGLRLNIPGVLENVMVSGNLDTNLYGILTVGSADEDIFIGPGKTLRLRGELTLWRNADGAGLKAMNTSVQLFSLPPLVTHEFSIQSNGKCTIDIPANKLILVPGGMEWQLPSCKINMDPSATSTFAIGTSTLYLPWLKKGIAMPGFYFELGKIFAHPLPDISQDISKLIRIYGKPTFHQKNGKFSLELKDAGLSIAGEDTLRLKNSFISTDGSFTVEAYQNSKIGIPPFAIGSSGSIKISYGPKQGFHLRISDPTLTLPIVGDIPLPSIDIGVQDRFVCQVALPSMSLGIFKVSGATYQLEIGKDYMKFLLLDQLGKPTTTLDILGVVSTLTLEEFVIDSQGNVFKGKMSGALMLLGYKSSHSVLKIVKNGFSFGTKVNLPHADVSLTATSSNLSDISQLKFSGYIDVARLNTEIRKIYEAFGIRGKISYQIDSIGKEKEQFKSGKEKLKKTKEELAVKNNKINFIKNMDERWTKNSSDPDGFHYCIPPIGHVEYWSNSQWQWNFGNPRYSKNDVQDVKNYYQYKRDLGIPANEPTRHDIGRFVNGALKAVNDKVHEIGRDISNTVQSVVNEIHKAISNDVLKKLNIDTTDFDQLNKEFNKGVDALESEAKKLHELNNKLLTYPLLEINKVTYTNQSVDILKTKNIYVKVNAKVFGDTRIIDLNIDLNDPAGTLTNNLKQFFPPELRKIVG